MRGRYEFLAVVSDVGQRFRDMPGRNHVFAGKSQEMKWAFSADERTGAFPEVRREQRSQSIECEVAKYSVFHKRSLSA